MLNNKQYLKTNKQSKNRLKTFDFIALCIISALMLILSLFGFISSNTRPLYLNENKVTEKRLHLDSNGNYVSDNLFDFYYWQNNTSGTVISGSMNETINISSPRNIGVKAKSTILLTANKTYYFKYYSDIAPNYTSFVVYNNNDIVASTNIGNLTYTYNRVNNYNVWSFSVIQNLNISKFGSWFNNSNFQVEFNNVGLYENNNIDYEPYGSTYYSKENYDNYGTTNYMNGLEEGNNNYIVNNYLNMTLALESQNITTHDDSGEIIVQNKEIDFVNRSGLVIDLTNVEDLAQDNINGEYYYFIDLPVKNYQMSNTFNLYANSAYTVDYIKVNVFVGTQEYEYYIYNSRYEKFVKPNFNYIGVDIEDQDNMALVKYNLSYLIEQRLKLYGVTTPYTISAIRMYDKIGLFSFTTDFYQQINENQELYQNGYNKGVENTIIDKYYGLTFNQIIEEGKRIGRTENYSLSDDIGNVVNMPLEFVGNMLNWEILGINVFGIFTSAVTLLLIVFIYRKLTK